MKNIVLIGMMGCGKSTIGKLLADKLGRQLVDTDDVIVKREGRSINEIFAESGEAYFREVEAQVIRELSNKGGMVIACGGGVPLREENRVALRSNGIVIFLNRDPKEIFSSVSMDGRPLGRGGEEKFLETYANREPIYKECANFEITGDRSPLQTVEMIMSRLKTIK